MSELLTGALLGALVTQLVNMKIARASRKESLRLAAADKRMAVHQEAFTRWSKVMHNLHDQGKRRDAIVECESWWEQNCLYLDPRSRKLFRDACSDAAIYDAKAEGARKAFDDLRSVLVALAEGVELPSIGENEFREPKGNGSSLIL